MKLIDSTTNKEVKVGDVVRTFLGMELVLDFYDTRRVYATLRNSGKQHQFMPEVIGCDITNDVN